MNMLPKNRSKMVVVVVGEAHSSVFRRLERSAAADPSETPVVGWRDANQWRLSGSVCVCVRLTQLGSLPCGWSLRVSMRASGAATAALAKDRPPWWGVFPCD